MIVYRTEKSEIDVRVYTLNQIWVRAYYDCSEIYEHFINRRFYESLEMFRKRSFKKIDKYIKELKKYEDMRKKIEEHKNYIRMQYHIEEKVSCPAVPVQEQLRRSMTSAERLVAITRGQQQTLDKLAALSAQARNTTETPTHTDAVAGSDLTLDYQNNVCAEGSTNTEKKRKASKSWAHRREVRKLGVKA